MLTLTAHHLQTNGKVDRYNCTIVVRLRHYVSELQRDWNLYVQPLTFAFNTQTYRWTRNSPFNFNLQRETSSIAIFRRWTGTASSMPRDAQSQHSNQRLWKRVEPVMGAVGRRMAAPKRILRTITTKRFTWATDQCWRWSIHQLSATCRTRLPLHRRVWLEGD